MIEAELREPAAGYRPVAMWFLNGRIEPDEVRRQVAAMAAGGIGGIQVAARTGLETPYLSERWFELVCQPDLMPFYRRWGFTERVGGSTLMRKRRPAADHAVNGTR